MAGFLSCTTQGYRALPSGLAPKLRFEAEQFPESRDSGASRARRGPVPQGQIFLRDTVQVPEGGMDLQGELVVHLPDTLELLFHVGRHHQGVVMMVMAVPYQASITNLPPGRYVLRRTQVLYVFSGDIRRHQLAVDSIVVIR